MYMLPGPVEYADPSNAPTPIPPVDPVACREGVGEIPSDAWYIVGSKPPTTWIAAAIQPNTYHVDGKKKELQQPVG